MPLKINAELQR